MQMACVFCNDMTKMHFEVPCKMFSLATSVSQQPALLKKNANNFSLHASHSRFYKYPHSCFICYNTAKFHCFCCPNALCGSCIDVAEFAPVRGKKGFCNDCLKLVLLAEQNVDSDSDVVCIGIVQLC